ncbi:hypothetical protein ACWCXH_24815 [Kitasatospora sp. NPDC001660]
MRRWITLTALTASLTGLAAPAVAADPEPSPGTTSVTIGEARIDPKVPGRVRVDLAYVCGMAGEAKSLTVTVEQTDPDDKSSKAFGSSRTAEADILCDGTQQQRQLVVQSKTVNWIPGADAILTATVSNLGANPPASADARRVRLAAG